MGVLQLPIRLERLITTGEWPDARSLGLDDRRWLDAIPKERVQAFAPEEEVIYLAKPPFRTVADEMEKQEEEDFWVRCGTLYQINPDRALIIGNFGFGSDAPIILHYSRYGTRIPVMYLRWGPYGRDNAWIEGAPDFDAFAAMIGLIS